MRNILKLFGKIMISLLIALLQVVYFVLLIKNMNSRGIFLWGISIILTLGTVLFVSKQKITPETKLYWIILILFFPVFGILSYFIFHSSISFFKLQKAIKVQEDKSSTYLYDDSKIIREFNIKKLEKYSQINYFHNVGCSIYQNCDIQYYPYGKDVLPDILFSLKQAKKFIFLEYFIISEGKIWEEILEILKQKARNGVEVRILFDDIGSAFHLKKNYTQELTKYNIQMMSFSPRNFLWEPATDNRNHRKSLIVDGEVVFIGGINIADECFEETLKFGIWKDSTVQIKGDAVFEFTKMFLVMWNGNIVCFRKNNFDQDNDYEKYKASTEKYFSSSYVVPYGHNPFNNKRVASDVYLNIINQATRYLYIYTPYLILDNSFKTSLLLAAKRGVEIKIVTPGIPDKKLVYQVTRSNYSELLAEGIQIFEYTPGFLHAKCMICDDKVAVVGAVNLDYRSLYTHFENGCYFYKGSIIHTMKKEFVQTLDDSREIFEGDIQHNFMKVFWETVLNLFAPLL